MWGFPREDSAHTFNASFSEPAAEEYLAPINQPDVLAEKLDEVGNERFHRYPL